MTDKPSGEPLARLRELLHQMRYSTVSFPAIIDEAIALAAQLGAGPREPSAAMIQAARDALHVQFDVLAGDEALLDDKLWRNILRAALAAGRGADESA
jgi:hypothetical protein